MGWDVGTPPKCLAAHLGWAWVRQRGDDVADIDASAQHVIGVAGAGLDPGYLSGAISSLPHWTQSIPNRERGLNAIRCRDLLRGFPANL